SSWRQTRRCRTAEWGARSRTGTPWASPYSVARGPTPALKRAARDGLTALPRHFVSAGPRLLQINPPPRPRGERERVEHAHVLERVFERQGEIGRAHHRPREPVGLNRVLIARRNRQRLRLHARRIGSVADEHPARPAEGRVERNLHFDAAGSAERVHALVWRLIHAAGADRV